MYGVRLLPFALLAATPVVLFAQRSFTSDYETAAMAWDRGDYVVALEGFRRLLSAPGGEGHLESLALLTGELFHTTELTPDGRAPRFSTGWSVSVKAVNARGLEGWDWARTTVAR